MAFYQARANNLTTMPRQSYQAPQQGYTPMERGSVSTTQAPQPSFMQQAKQGADMVGMGKAGVGLYDKAMGLLAPSIDFATPVAAAADAAGTSAFLGSSAPAMASQIAPNAAFLGGEAGLLGSAGMAADSAALSSMAGTGLGSLGSSAAMATPMLETAALAGAAEAGTVGTAAATGLGAGAAEAGMLSALGPVGIAAGIGLLGTKLFGLW